MPPSTRSEKRADGDEPDTFASTQEEAVEDYGAEFLENYIEGGAAAFGATTTGSGNSEATESKSPVSMTKIRKTSTTTPTDTKMSPFAASHQSGAGGDRADTVGGTPGVSKGVDKLKEDKKLSTPTKKDGQSGV